MRGHNICSCFQEISLFSLPIDTMLGPFHIDYDGSVGCYNSVLIHNLANTELKLIHYVT